MDNFIIGKNSFIGQQIAKSLIQKNDQWGADWKFTTSNFDQSITEKNKFFYLDLESPENFDYSILSNKSNIILLAGISSPDLCEENKEFAHKINFLGTKYFINECIKRGARVLFFSSDLVYGKSDNIFDENSLAEPVGFYGKLKREIENSFDSSNFKVFRLSYVLSQSDKYIDYLNRCIVDQIEPEIFHPLFRNIVYIDDVIEATKNILFKWHHFNNMIFNICGEKSISRKDIADKIIKNNCYKIVNPGEKFWSIRPNNIKVSSLYFESLIQRKPVSFSNAMRIIKHKKK